MNGRAMRLPVRPVAAFLLLLAAAGPGGAADRGAGTARIPADEALRRGERMYREGALPSGKPLKAVVQGDMEVTGAVVTCAGCHMRSGLGSIEGKVITPPTNGARLFAPRRGVQDLPRREMARALLSHKRPAYTEASLAKALRTGVDPTGRKFARTMPRYALDDEEMEILIGYLKHLSSDDSPGVTADGIRFATVVAAGAGAGARDALLKPLRAWLEKEWNANLALRVPRWRDEGYRWISLDVWELRGPASTWRDQLEAHYRREPVFALVGGTAPGSWSPVHEFCEKNRIPCVFPVTELPAISTSDWYTLYFSKGYYQEGEAAARYLARAVDPPAGTEVVQIYRSGEAGNAFSRGVSDAWKASGKSPVKSRVIAAGEKTGGEFWKEISAAHPGAVMLVWLGPEDLAGIDTLGEVPDRSSAVVASAAMLAGKITTIPEGIRDFTLLTYPARLPEESGQIATTVTQWLRANGLPVEDPAVSAKVFFMTRLLNRVLKDMRGNYYRDYFLDLFDGVGDQTAAAVSAPRLSFGPGQRYASKGCYIVKLTRGADPKVVPRSGWIAD